MEVRVSADGPYLDPVYVRSLHSLDLERELIEAKARISFTDVTSPFYDPKISKF